MFSIRKFSFMYKIKSQKNNYYIFTGGPGAGKSSILDELKNRGYPVVAEVARKIIKEQLAIGGDATHMGNRVAFRDLMLKHSIAAYTDHLQTKGKMFFDRGIPDLYGYSELIKVSVSKYIKQAIEEYRYNATVFMFPPWQEIYSNDEERKQDFQEALTTYHLIKKGYIESGYDLIEVPKASINNRATFILEKIEHYKNQFKPE